jgi:hypothetical protein
MESQTSPGAQSWGPLQRQELKAQVWLPGQLVPAQLHTPVMCPEAPTLRQTDGEVQARSHPPQWALLNEVSTQLPPQQTGVPFPRQVRP